MGVSIRGVELDIDKTYTTWFNVCVMKRYQVYLNPHSVSVLDVASDTIEMSRSKLIQNVVDRLSEEIIDVVIVEKTSRKKQYAMFDKYAGFIDNGSKKKHNYSQTVDEIYKMI